MDRVAFGAHLLSTLTGGALTLLVSVGHRTGLFDAAAEGPATSEGLARRAGLHERYVREWLGALTAGGFFTYDAVTKEYALPADHAVFLTGEAAVNVAPTASMLRALAGALPGVERCMVSGGGVPHGAYGPHFDAIGVAQGDTWRRIYDEQLVDGFLGAVPGLIDRLRSGISVLDVGCGAGHAVNVAAQAFPSSVFHGIDQDARLIARAERERVALQLPNASFSVADAAALPARPGYDLITAFDSIHDQRASAEVLRRIRAALNAGGLFVMVDAGLSSDLESNLADPHAPLIYAISLMYCTPASLAEDGAALGAAWGVEQAHRLLAEAGFSAVRLPSPRPQTAIHACTPRTPDGIRKLDDSLS